MAIGDRIREIRLSQNLTQDELASLAGISRVAVGNYERGDRIPPADVVANIASALGVPVQYLFSDPEPDREYELICDTLRVAGFEIEQSTAADEFLVSHADNPDESEIIKYDKLAEVVSAVLKDAEKIKDEYIRRRLELELFWPRGSWVENKMPFNLAYKGDSHENK